MTKAIIFDIGGVVTFTDFPALYANFARRAGISPEFVVRYHADNWPQMLQGDISLERFFEDMRKEGASKALDLRAIWLEEGLKVRTVNTELLEYIAKLKSAYTVGVLSNLTATRLIMDEATNLYAGFDFVVLSCTVGMKKPDPKFYELALVKAGVKASQAVFVDDKERNTLSARELGFTDILYCGNQKLFSALRQLGIFVH